MHVLQWDCSLIPATTRELTLSEHSIPRQYTTATDTFKFTERRGPVSNPALYSVVLVLSFPQYVTADAGSGYLGTAPSFHNFLNSFFMSYPIIGVCKV
jgi:hypothetical protein